MSLKQVWLREETLKKLDENRGKIPRAAFADEVIRYGINYKKEIILEIVPDFKKKWGRPKKVAMTL